MSRILWIDASKGIAIILVVFGHVLGGASARGWVDNIWASTVYNFIYSFHMPLFFLIAGALSIQSIRTNLAYAFWSRVGSLAWPYLLWGVIFIVIQPLISAFMLFPPSQNGLSESFYKLAVGESSWFLWTLFVAHCILLLSRKVPLWFLLVVSIGVALSVSAKALAISNLIQLLPFMVLGAIGGDRLTSLHFETRWKALIVSLVSFGLLAFYTWQNGEKWPGGYLLAGVLGSLGTIALVQTLTNQASSLLGIAGKGSLAVFLLHPYFQGASRELISHLIGGAPAWQLIVPTAMGVIGPVFVWILSEKLKVTWLFRIEATKSPVLHERAASRSVKTGI